MHEKYEGVIGLEVHAQLLTNSKIFCNCSAKFGNEPNTNICPICLGHPGVLPVLNKKVVEFTVLMGLATNCIINERSIFARKNYFYPDLPKGYQISQYEEPACEHGFIEITLPNAISKKIRITRIHMEEDAGKSIHESGLSTSVDLNRCGVPLIEIVSDPDMRSSNEAYLYLSRIKQILQYLGICDGNMEEGSLRCDANISIRLRGENNMGTKTEVKNMNSFRNVERAINFEINRQMELLEDGSRIIQETLLWDADKNKAYSMRSKEEAHDYRYFPEPDLFPIFVDNKWKNELTALLPELPNQRKNRFINSFKLPEYDAEILTQSKDIADYYEKVIAVTDDYKSASNWVMGDVLKIINEKKIDIKDFSIAADNLAELINIINDNTISGKIAKEIFPEMFKENKKPLEIVKSKNLLQITDKAAIAMVVDNVLSNFPNELEEFLNGKEKVFGFFIGKIMQETKGKANPKIVNELLREKISLFNKITE
jgi:aspartyl-tRNA(Asn)/glutamyl-tRNA(Gln) amidotransferase subunit B